MTDLRVTQEVVEALTQPQPALRVTQHVVEVLGTTVAAPPAGGGPDAPTTRYAYTLDWGAQTR